MNNPVSLTPTEFELFVKRVLEEEGGVGLKDFSVVHQDRIDASDGSYKFDATARFEALGADFLVLVECKHHADPIKREVVQVLQDKLHSVHAHKAMLFSTSAFQRGALRYAKEHRIAMVQIIDGRAICKAKALGVGLRYPDWVPRHVAQLATYMSEGQTRCLVLGTAGPPERHPVSQGYLAAFLREDGE